MDYKFSGNANIAYKQFTEYPFNEYLEFVSHSNSKTGSV